jgi:DNA-binding NarL/FixJ family response regulator
MGFRVLVVDDHEIVRRGVCSLLQGRTDWEICGEAADGREAVQKARQLKPDAVILDIGLPGLNGLDAARHILSENSSIKILVLTLHDSDQVMRDVLRAGAQGFLLKSDAARDLVAAVDALRNDKTYFTPKLANIVLDGYLHGDGGGPVPPATRLTPRELEIVHHLAEGKSTRQLAEHLKISAKTAETHRANIMRKLGLHSVSDLVLYAIRNNIVTVENRVETMSTVPAEN